jgi:glycosyltransferase involved in cell wall biosynthesis
MLFGAEAAMTRVENRLLVVLSSLCAEGTPVLVLELCRWWMSHGISPIVVTLSESPNDLESEFRAAGVPLATIRLPRSGSIRFAKLTFEMYRLCQRLRPRAVLSMPLGWHAFMFMGARAAGVRFTAAHVGNYPPQQPGLALAKFRFLVQLGRPVTDTLICCSSYIQRGAREHFGVLAQETEVIYNGIDVEGVSRRATSVRANTKGGRGPFVVGMVARLEVHKDQPTLLRAAALVKGAGQPLEVWLVGEGSRRAEYERLIVELGLDQSVRLLGMRRDVPELLGQMDAFVFSAKLDEGLGVALIEAMAARVPIVATDVGACREVLEDGALAKLVPPGDAAAMADAILSLTRQSVENRDQLENAKKRAVDVFSIEEMARRYARCLNLL